MGFNLLLCLILLVLGVLRNADSFSDAQSIGKCYSSHDCQDSYSAAGGSWTREDCCTIGNQCWCDHINGRCQPTCSSSRDEETGVQLILGKCYSTKDCSRYSEAGGKWTKNDCCTIGSQCWCDRYNGRCQPTCSSSHNEEAGSQIILGRCYSTKDCSSYSAASGKWTKNDCCAIGNQCWCDENGWCRPTCLDSDNYEDSESHIMLGKCYSTRDCTYSAAGGKWTMEDCCAIGSRCWCDQNGRCHPTCMDYNIIESHSEENSTALGPQSNHTHSTHMLYLLFLILTVVFPVSMCVLCIWCVKKSRVTTNVNLNYVQVNKNVS